ncbi:hypothetical protein MTO96_016384 [Rhipicephalus appendiculatus]
MHTDRAPLLDEAEPCDGEGTEADVQRASMPASPEAAPVSGESAGADAAQVAPGVADSGCPRDSPGAGSSADYVLLDTPSPSSQSVANLMEAAGDRASPASPPGERRGRSSHICSLSRHSPILLLITLLNLTVLLLVLLYWRQKVVQNSSKGLRTSN